MILSLSLFKFIYFIVISTPNVRSELTTLRSRSDWASQASLDSLLINEEVCAERLGNLLKVTQVNK